ncbi:thioredoxin family protein [Ulvibacter antarcticus]|uniref:Thioredoxin-related protein n=1 Tax=Ulvibacter antarcticus TaxID=442714 RepID=A0A3L9Z3A9_9FLAO|nr:thioredoxin fold domain-containing protein [Ulvibacter antarcticus]RMA66487.1 thioredoxin-related protein [Ulvibacter antarcticus]
MKKILLLFIILITTGVSAQKIQWMTMNEALAAQKVTPKKIFMDVYTVWCGPCKMLDKNTFSNKDVIEYVNEHYYAVKFNAEGTEEIIFEDFTYTNPNYQEGRKGRNATHFFADALKLRGYPSLVFFEADGTLIQALPGYKTPPQLEVYLKMIGSGDYKNVNTAEAWQEYQQNFKSTFKG